MLVFDCFFTSDCNYPGVMVHPDTELRLVNDLIGHGVFATKLIPKGTITWVRDRLDQAFTPQQMEAMPSGYKSILDKYTFIDGQGKYILCWDISRFINHSCSATCLSPGFDFELAVRDIQPGEELTDDYGTLNLREPFQCACGLPDCRKWIMPDDMVRYANRWDGLVQEAFTLILDRTQPLWEYIEEKEQVTRALKESKFHRSIRANYSPAA